MTHPHTRRGAAAAIAVAALIGAALPTAAHAADFEVVLPGGTACAFDLMITGTGGRSTTKEFTDADGHTVRILTAGTGQALTFTNVVTKESLSLRSNGAVSSTTFQAGGLSTTTGLGHNVLILYPSDVPAGPSTTLYSGRVTYTVDSQGVWTILGSSGPTRDICAELEE